MFRAQFILRGCSRREGENLPELAIGHLLEALAAWNADYIRQRARIGRPVPALYDLFRAGRIRYERERVWTVLHNGQYRSVGREDWLDCEEAIKRGVADCEDLACWRAGELRAAGEAAKVLFSIRERPHSGRLFHIIVERGNGAVEDPSRALGMRP